ncbi:MAG: YceI family protein [Cytophagaceae bacterium]|nr:YceI family protein [Cytophagaceae bacterium]
MTNQTKWSIDQAHSDITFRIRHLMIAHVKGAFKTFDANIYTTGNDFSTAEIDVWIDASSINTGDANRDDHLKALDFLDVKNHKQITFISSTIGPMDKHHKHELWGELTIVGIKQNAKLDVEYGGIVKDPWGNDRAGFTVTGAINRADWGLVWNTNLEAGGIMIGDQINISCEIEVINVGFKDLKLELDNMSTASVGI